MFPNCKRQRIHQFRSKPPASARNSIKFQKLYLYVNVIDAMGLEAGGRPSADFGSKFFVNIHGSVFLCSILK